MAPRFTTTSNATATIATRHGWRKTGVARLGPRSAARARGVVASAIGARLCRHTVRRRIVPRACRVSRVAAGTVAAMAISGVADLTGRVLAGRYRLLAPIGAGASGRVYVADDVRLRRRVAIKVLHARARRGRRLPPALPGRGPGRGVAEPPERDGGLRLGRRRRALHGARAAHRAAACAACSTPARASARRRPRTSGGRSPSALEYAHARGVVHRDIKPANLLFDEHGIVRVADFGLARALAEASWTEPAGTVVGTARYAAPEQATGAPLDGRADLYSLAIVLVEAVTGTVPASPTPRSARSPRARTTPLVAPLELGRLGPVVERAGRPDPAERYPDAATMRAALADAARALPPPQPLALAGLVRRRSTPASPRRSDARRRPQVFDQDAPEPRRRRARPVGRCRSAARRAPGAQPLVSVVVRSSWCSRSRSPAYAVAAQHRRARWRRRRSSASAPTTAKVRVADAGLSITLVERNADDPKGMVIAQHPDPGRFVREHGDVELVVSRGLRR